MLFFDPAPESRAIAGLLKVVLSAVLAGGLCQCTTSKPKGDVVVSVKDQKLGVYSTDGKLAKKYVISTSKFGLGDQRGSNRTPLGTHEIVAKIGHGLPAGAVLKSRRWNGEVLKPNAPGRDPIVSRILWLKGTEKANQNAFNRFIYIHGTPEENRLGKPASYGCVRMGMKDVVDLFNTVNVGAKVVITQGHLPTGAPVKPADAGGADGSPTLGPASSGEPIEVARIIPTDGEKKRAAENEAKTRGKPGAAKSASNTAHPSAPNVASKGPGKSKARA